MSMPSLSNTDQSPTRGIHPREPSSRLRTGGTPSELKSTPDQNSATESSATGSGSQQLSEESDATTIGALCDGGTFENASPVTLQDAFPWHEVGVKKHTQKIPPTIVPVLLQSVSREVDDGAGSPEGDVPRYSVLEKGKWMAKVDEEEVMLDDDSVSSHFFFDSVHNSVEDWAMHNRPILQEYADRQTSLPLGRRLDVSINEHDPFTLGAIQLLVNRDKMDCTHRSRQLGPQLIENFVDIDHWAREYFRCHHAMHVVDSDVPILLTIVMNSYYEGLVQLIDQLVGLALENMRDCGRVSLGVEDFAFGFDFRMSQDLPFYAETSSRIREPLPIPAMVARPTFEPMMTSSGRQVKPTERAQAASKQVQTDASEKRGRQKSTAKPEGKDKQTSELSTPRLSLEKNAVQSISQRTEAPATSQVKPDEAALAPPETTPMHTKYRPKQPSNLSLPPIFPGSSSTAEKSSLKSNGSSNPELSASASEGCQKASGLESNLTTKPARPLTIRIPPLRLANSTATTKKSSEPASETNTSTSHANPSANVLGTSTNKGRRASPRPRGPRDALPRGRGQERGSSPLITTTCAATPGAIKSQREPSPVKAEKADNSCASEPPTTPPTTVDPPERAPESASTTQLHEVKQKTSARQERSPSPLRLRTGKLLRAPADPSHPRAKKRKLDDCED